MLFRARPCPRSRRGPSPRPGSGRWRGSSAGRTGARRAAAQAPLRGPRAPGCGRTGSSRSRRPRCSGTRPRRDPPRCRCTRARSSSRSRAGVDRAAVARRAVALEEGTGHGEAAARRDRAAVRLGAVRGELGAVDLEARAAAVDRSAPAVERRRGCPRSARPSPRSRRTGRRGPPRRSPTRCRRRACRSRWRPGSRTTPPPQFSCAVLPSSSLSPISRLLASIPPPTLVEALPLKWLPVTTAPP